MPTTRIHADTRRLRGAYYTYPGNSPDVPPAYDAGELEAALRAWPASAETDESFAEAKNEDRTH